MNEKKFGRILETGMGFIMSWVPEYIGNVFIRSSNDTGYGISCLGGGLCYCGSH